MAPRPVNKLAATSLTMGLVGWLMYALQGCFDLSLGLLLAGLTAGSSALCSTILDILPFFLWLAGIVSGHAALGRIKRNGEAGRGRAIAGLVLSYSGMFFIVLLIVLLLILVAVGIKSGWLTKLLPFHP